MILDSGPIINQSITGCRLSINCGLLILGRSIRIDYWLLFLISPNLLVILDSGLVIDQLLVTDRLWITQYSRNFELFIDQLVATDHL